MADIIVGSVGVQLVPSAQGFAEKARALLRGLSVPVKLDIDSKAAEADLEEFTKRPREATVKVKADTKDAETKIGALDGSARGAGVGMGLLTAAAIGLAPALIPATAAVGGLVAALTAPVLATGGGLVGFIAVAGVAVSKTEAVNKQIKELSKQAENATNMATAKRYQAQAQALIDSLTGPQKALLTAQHVVSTAFSSLMKSSGPAIFAPIVGGLHLLATLLPHLAPLITAVSGAFDQLIASMTNGVKGGGFDKAIGFFSRLAGPSITGLATIIGNIAKGFLSMAQASSGLGGSLLGSLEQMTAKFANIGQSKGFQSFLAYVQQVGPQVAHTIGSIVDAVVNIGRALAPLGGPALAAIKGIADAIGNMNPTLLGMIAATIGAVVIGLKAMKIVTTLTPMVKSFAAALGIMDVAADANPVGAIVVGLVALGAAFAYAWAKSETFRKIVVTALKVVANYYIGFVELFVKGAAKAFGWIPGIGPKLKAAASAVASFRDSVNASLDGITKTVTITLNIQRIDTSGPGNAALNAEHSGGYKVPAAPKTSSTTPDLSYDPSLFTAPSTSAATSAANAKANAKAAAKAAKLRDNDSLLTSVRALRSAGKQLTAALTQGLRDGTGGLEKYLAKIKSDIGTKLASGDISKAAAKSMRQTVNAISKGLKSIEAQYDAAYKTIQDLQQAKEQATSSVSSSLTGELDLSQSISQPNQFGFGGGTATFASVSSVISGLATRLKAFAGLIKSMLSAGFPAALVQEVANLGSTNGIAVAQALLSGSKTQISGVVSAFGDITTSANTIGQAIGDALYDPGIAAQQGLLKGLLDDKGITDAGGKLAKKLTKAIRKALKIHSPSKLMADQVGHPAGQGIGVGTLAAIDGWIPDVARRMTSIQPAPSMVGGGMTGARLELDYERLADALSQRPNVLRMDDRGAAKLQVAMDRQLLVTSFGG